jgi:hypothetical protein
MLQEIVLKVVSNVIDKATPAIRQDIVNLVDSIDEKAKQTPNPFDDVLVDLLRAILKA